MTVKVNALLLPVTSHDAFQTFQGVFTSVKAGLQCAERPVLRGVHVPLSAAQIEKNPIPAALAMQQHATELSGTYCKPGITVAVRLSNRSVFPTLHK